MSTTQQTPTIASKVQQPVFSTVFRRPFKARTTQILSLRVLHVDRGDLLALLCNVKGKVVSLVIGDLNVFA